METTRHSTFEVIIFQVWRPLSSCSFELMGSHRIENYRVGRDDLVDTSTVEALTPIAVESGDVVGVYVEDGTSSVQEYSDSSMTYIVEEAEGSDDVSMVDFCTGAVTSNAGAPIITAVVIEGQCMFLYILYMHVLHAYAYVVESGCYINFVHEPLHVHTCMCMLWHISHVSIHVRISVSHRCVVCMLEYYMQSRAFITYAS